MISISIDNEIYETFNSFIHAAVERNCVLSWKRETNRKLIFVLNDDYGVRGVERKFQKINAKIFHKSYFVYVEDLKAMQLFKHEKYVFH